VDDAYLSPAVGLPVADFGAVGDREDQCAARGRDVRSCCLTVSWIQ
jgi:hypothetical protein